MTTNNDASRDSLTKALADLVDHDQNPPMSIYEWEIKQIFENVGASDSPEREHEKFARLALLADCAFPDHNRMTDAEIQADPVTPLLMRYLLRALKMYSAEIETLNQAAKKEGPQATNKRQALLAKAFGLTESRGGNARGVRWTERLKMRTHEVFSSALNAGGSDEQAWVDAFMKAYDMVYEPDTTRDFARDPVSINKNRRELFAVLRDLGFDLRHFKSI